ncbi:PadR family transcriptional regulator [Erysipelothrix sp. HDW6C]|uniref:PadR family transcriptional regulator n=1 Tax=Erysipelothrix sp. HDW6C TaxID=2714930 RepID=UPI001407C545|nr:PadR family transcriptional regulator [Erysipelothrix sp. HDW6C]QIK69448.1 PadR family transcriptional regulator [Erysipelothrix sp. HDW6C]
MIPLLILGLIYQNPDSSGYDLLRLMDERHYKYIVKVTKGSFYYNVQQLEEKGHINQVDTGEVSSHDARHYKITDSGINTFNELMKHYGSITDYVNLTLYGPLLFADMYDKKELLELLELQIQQTQAKVELLEMSLVTAEPSYFTMMLANSRAHHLVNIEWFTTLIENLH